MSNSRSITDVTCLKLLIIKKVTRFNLRKWKFEDSILLVNQSSCGNIIYVLQIIVNKKLTFSSAYEILYFQCLDKSTAVKDLHIIFWYVEEGTKELFTFLFIQIFKVYLEITFLQIFYQRYVSMSSYLMGNTGCISYKIFCAEWKDGGTCPYYIISPKMFIMYGS